MKSAIAIALLFAVSAMQTAAAGEGKKPEYQSLSLSGKVVSQQKQVLDKQGEVKTVTVFYLQSDDSRVALPEHRNCKGELQVDLKQYDGQQVRVTARGFQKLGKNGKQLTMIHEIVAVRAAQPANATSAFPTIET